MDGDEHGLFRSEAIDARRAPQFGEPLLPNPFAHSVAAIGALVCLCAGVALVTLLDIPRRATVRGFIAPDLGLVRVHAPQPATLTALRVAEGDRVVAGQQLAVLVAPQGTQREVDPGGAQSERFDVQRIALDDQRRLDRAATDIERDGLQARSSSLALEIAQLDAQLTTGAERARLAAARVVELRPLAAAGLIARHQLLQLEETALEARAAAQALQRDAVALRRELSVLEADRRVLGVRAAQHASENSIALARLARDRTETEARHEFVLRAPVAGTVTALTAQPGAAVGPTQPLLTLLPDGARLEARLLVPSRDAGLLQLGQRVSLRIDAFPFQRFGLQHGWVRSVTRSIQLPGEVDHPVTLDAPAYAVLVALDAASVSAYGRQWPLKPGLLLEADIVLERTPLYRRLLDPLRAIVRVEG